ncbi:hypothetical protein PMAYCL1PPCAC_29187 [Pristionchus mayeri]|uniref:Uncharacterized protein n=1 Tax=Pristionchus mayeri TaxID=1317129 RepID=A0AAN5IAM7_9BILA|nr:hypothetical protein PMAYCL1PPCAC_29187 [Pristionchus mayeri]
MREEETREEEITAYAERFHSKDGEMKGRAIYQRKNRRNEEYDSQTRPTEWLKRLFVYLNVRISCKPTCASPCPSPRLRGPIVFRISCMLTSSFRSACRETCASPSHRSSRSLPFLPRSDLREKGPIASRISCRRTFSSPSLPSSGDQIDRIACTLTSSSLRRLSNPPVQIQCRWLR